MQSIIKNFDFKILENKIILTASPEPTYIYGKDDWIDIEEKYLNDGKEFKDLKTFFYLNKVCGKVILNVNKDVDFVLNNIDIVGDKKSFKTGKCFYHNLWVDGASNIEGKIVLPKDTYSKIYKLEGNKDNPKKILLKKDIDYYFKDGKTHIPMKGFSGIGTEEEPWEVSSYDDLLHIGSADDNHPDRYREGWTLDSHYIQTQDIDCTDEEFIPIGRDDEGNSKDFTGSFDGQGFKIKNLEIYTGETYSSIGLFDRGRHLNLKNIHLRNINITSNGGSNSHCGGIAGYVAYFDISSCSVTGTLNSTGGAGGIASSAGGLPGTVKNCYFRGEINGRMLAGIARRGRRATFTNCYVKATFDDEASRANPITNDIFDHGKDVVNCYHISNLDVDDEESGVKLTEEEAKKIESFPEWSIAEYNDKYNIKCDWYIDNSFPILYHEKEELIEEIKAEGQINLGLKYLLEFQGMIELGFKQKNFFKGKLNFGQKQISEYLGEIDLKTFDVEKNKKLKRLFNDSLYIKENIDIEDGIYYTKYKDIEIKESPGEILYIDKNKIYFKKRNIKGSIIYKINNTFIANIEDGKTKIVFANNHDKVKIHMEKELNTPFYNINNINLNPAFTDIRNGFLYISNKKQEVNDIEFTVPPDIQEGEYIDLKIKFIDDHNNPVYPLEHEVEISIENGDYQIKDKKTDPYGNIYLTILPDNNCIVTISYKDIKKTVRLN